MWQDTYQTDNGRWGFAIWDTSYSDSFPVERSSGYSDELSAMRAATAAKRDHFERYHMARED